MTTRTADPLVHRLAVLLDRDGTIIVDTRLRRLGRAGRVHRRCHRGDRPAQRRGRPGRGGHQPGRRGPRPLRARGRGPRAQAHGGGAGRRGRARRRVAVLSLPPGGHGRRPFARASADRKPAPGMALAAAEALDLDLSASWVVGDSACDVGLARAVGARPLCIGGRPDRGRVPSTVPDLAVAVDRILAEPPRRAVAGARPVPTLPVRPVRPTPDASPTTTRSELARAMVERRPRPGPRRPQVLNARLRARRDGLRLRQRRFGVDRQPPAVRPRQGGPHRHRPAHPGAQPEHQHRDPQRDRQRHRLRVRLRVPARSRRRDPATSWSWCRRRAARPTSSGPWSGRRRQRDADHRPDRLRRRPGARAGRRRRSTSTRATTGSSRTRTRPACTSSRSTCASRG